MPALSERKSSGLAKVLVLGDSGTGKTSLLVSLVKAGYKLRIMDFDNLLGPLVKQIERVCPDKLDSVGFMPFRDKMKTVGVVPSVDGAPQAFLNALKALDKWEDGTVPSKWGPEYVLVIDSVTRMGDMAEFWADGYIVPTGKGGKDGRAIVGEAQRAIESVFNYIGADNFFTNVVVICHITYVDTEMGARKGYPKAPGNKFSPLIPSFFDTVVQTEYDPGSKSYRVRTKPSPILDLKNPSSFELPEFLPSDSALATIFATLTKGKSA